MVRPEHRQWPRQAILAAWARGSGLAPRAMGITEGWVYAGSGQDLVRSPHTSQAAMWKRG